MPDCYRQRQRRVLEKRIESIRRFEYNRGYADGRAKRGKANYFNSTLRLI
jgi:hypothetical protein